MWLLDHNVPRSVFRFLVSLKIHCETTPHRGWENLKNGELVTAASNAGFVCILTRDVEFGQAASKALKSSMHFGVVLLTLDQARGSEYLNNFCKTWKKSPITPISGRMIHWPK